MVGVRLESVSKSFEGGVDAVKNLSLKIEDKDVKELLKKQMEE